MASKRAENILTTVRSIPEGFVQTYGDIAPDVPRLVGRVLSTTHDGVPWHRVVRADISARLPSASNVRAAIAVRDLQRHMRRDVSAMLAMRTVLPTSLSSRSLRACHSTTETAPA